MKIVYMGTPDFAVTALQKLAQTHEIVGVFSQPDKPKGRGKQLAAPAVKLCAEALGIPVFQPQTLRSEDVLHTLEQLCPDVIVVAAYGKILPAEILQLPRYGCINIHASLLPKLRGAAPIQRAILEGEKRTGITTMQMAQGLDTGDILLQRSVEIGENENAVELYERLSRLGAELILQTLEGIARGEISPVPQREQEATYAAMLERGMSSIDWKQDAQVIHNQIRGLQPWPIASTEYRGRRLKIYRSLLKGPRAGHAGEIVLERGQMLVVCGDGNAIELCEVQLEGGRRMAACDMLRGHPAAPGETLCE